jgi:hypothetical protein
MVLRMCEDWDARQYGFWKDEMTWNGPQNKAYFRQKCYYAADTALSPKPKDGILIGTHSDCLTNEALPLHPTNTPEDQRLRTRVDIETTRHFDTAGPDCYKKAFMADMELMKKIWEEQQKALGVPLPQGPEAPADPKATAGTK